MLKAVKEQIRSIPARGIGYGLLRHFSPDETVRARLAGIRPEIAFNYLGRLDSVLGAESRFALAPEPIGYSRSPRGRRRHTLELTVVGLEGKLRFDWTFSRELHRRETIERLSSSYLTALRALVAHCLEPSAGGYTPSDFALAGLSQAQLDAILREKTSGRGP
jgi:non-ribosomal peptide synthase protein (TIGR01720 family)